MWWVWLASKWWLFHVKHVWGHWGFGGGCPTEGFHNVEAILFIGFSALSPQYIPCSCCWNQLLKRLLNVLSNLVYGKFPHPYHARQFGCWLSHCCLLSPLCTVSLLLSSFFTNEEGHKYMFTWQGMPSHLLVCTSVSTHGSLVAFWLGWEKQPLSPFCKGRM